MSEEEMIAQTEFMVTKEYRRFAEFCDACLRYRSIGLCYGLPGVGKTLSARHYTQWEFLEPLLAKSRSAQNPPVEVIGCHTILYTPAVANTPKRIEEEVRSLRMGLSYLIDDAEHVQRGEEDWTFSYSPPERTDLLVVDEADRLKVLGLEQVRDIYDRSHIGLILIGMPGLEKRLARYPQLYSRVGFVHEFHPLGLEEARFILQQRWQQWGLALQADDFTDMEVVTAILRITEGNFSVRDQAITYLLFSTAIRLGECAALNLDDVRVSSRKGVVIIRSGKGDTYREVPLNAEAREVLKTWLKERTKRFSQISEPAFFLNAPGKRLSARSIDLIIRRIGVDAHLELSAHVLRHTCLTNLVRHGHDLVLVAEIAGHKRLETTRRYCLPSNEDRERAMESLHSEY